MTGARFGKLGISTVGTRQAYAGLGTVHMDISGLDGTCHHRLLEG